METSVFIGFFNLVIRKIVRRNRKTENEFFFYQKKRKNYMRDYFVSLSFSTINPPSVDCSSKIIRNHSVTGKNTCATYLTVISKLGISSSNC